MFTRSLQRAALVVGATIALSCSTEKKEPVASTSAAPEATSLPGKPLFPREISPETRTRLEGDLAAAKAAYDHAPNDADSIIWYGRRLAYLERYRDAIKVFSEGVAKHPEDSRMYRFRGHRYITVREFDNAIADLAKAAELIKGQTDETEPDGAPNKLGIPTSTKHGNIYYHLALAYYLKAQYADAIAVWDDAFRIATNDDTRVAVNDWRYMTLRRLKRDADAKQLLATVTKNLNVIENTAYLRRMLMYKGELPPDSLLAQGETEALQFVTQGYGVGNWYLANGDTTRAFEIFEKVVQNNYWAAFGFIAAEADLVRAGKK